MSSTHQADAPARGGAFAPDRGIVPGLHLILSATTRTACHSAIAQTVTLLEDLFGLSILLAAEAAEFNHGPVIVWKRAGIETFADTDVVIAWLKRAQTCPGRTLAFGAAASGLMAAGATESAAPQILLVADSASLPAELETAMRDMAEFSARHLFHLNREEEMHRRLRRDVTEGAQHEALLRAQAELSWQAGADDILHVT
jgi:hypothetical protein